MAISVKKVNFQIRGETIRREVRDFELYDATLLDPTNADALVDGEWVKFDADGKLVRALDAAAATDINHAPCWPLFQLKASYDMQALGKGPVIFDCDGLEIETNIYKDDDGFAVGDETGVGTVTDAALVDRAGLKKVIALPAIGASDEETAIAYMKDPERVVGVVTATPAQTASGMLRVLLRQGR